jgi:excinuclease ABC subunit B
LLKQIKNMDFKLETEYKPAGDQPKAIAELVAGVKNGEKYQCLLGVTGSGKTFTMANLIQQVQKPTLILSHNKTLTAQLYGEFKQFFPENAVEYFVSYYDYYQPEAYIASSDTYIEKDLAINAEIEKLRLRSTTQLLSGRNDVIVVASVSCIYGMGNPEDYKSGIIRLQAGQVISRNQLLYKLVDSLYSRTEVDFAKGTFRVKGDTVDVHLPYVDYGYRITFFGDEIEEIELLNVNNNKTEGTTDAVAIFPANLYIAPKERLVKIIHAIQDELNVQAQFLESELRYDEAARLRERVNLDIEMMRQVGYCSGIENYSRFFDGRDIGMRPFCLLDYFPDDFLMIIDESHATLPQFRAMYAGDRARKISLIEHGFRLPSALDNRPLNFDEFESVQNQVIYVSATPSDYELQKTSGVVVEQIVRPTGLLDPPIEVRSSINQIDDLIEEIRQRAAKSERVLITTITKRMAEELAKYLTKVQVRCRYIHADVDTMERVEILRDLRLGEFDVLIGINLLREGLDLPEVSLVAILDADKEGFLRNERSLTQTAGRAARNSNGKVIFYADKITPSMQRTIDESRRRRDIQIAYNTAHNITPTTVSKTRAQILEQSAVLNKKSYIEDINEDFNKTNSLSFDPIVNSMTYAQLEKAIAQAKDNMQKAAKDQDFLTAAQYRDEMFMFKKLLDERK